MSGKKRKDARPLCVCGCGQKVNKFTAKYLPGHHRRGIKGEIAPFYGKTHDTFARRMIAYGQNDRQYNRLLQMLENNKERRGIKSKERVKNVW